jgi:transcription initiation factor IIE alpha subunit
MTQMTEQEAIKALKERLMYLDDFIEMGEPPNETLGSIKSEIMSLQLAIQALEYRVTKKPNIESNQLYCPTCHSHTQHSKYHEGEFICLKCGQKLKED